MLACIKINEVIYPLSFKMADLQNPFTQFLNLDHNLPKLRSSLLKFVVLGIVLVFVNRTRNTF